MLELPELEVTKDRLRLSLAGRVITGLELRRPECLRTADPPASALSGRHVRSVLRLGRFLVFGFDERLRLCLDLGRSGRLGLGPAAAPWTREHLAALRLDPEDLRVIEPGPSPRVEFHLLADDAALDRVARPGLDPLGEGFSLARFRSALARRDRPLKRFLTDRRLFGAIGFCYADEILFEARLSPFAAAAGLKPEAAIRLYLAIKKVLHDAILRLRPLDRLPEPADRTSLRVHGRAGRPCPACGGTVRRIGREETTADCCPACQPGPA